MKNRAIVPPPISDDLARFADELTQTTGQVFPYPFVKYVYETSPEFVDQTNAVATLLNRADMVKVVGDNIAAQMRIKYKVLLDQYEQQEKG